MDKTLTELIYGSLLREIGRIKWRIHRGKGKQTISELGFEWASQSIQSNNILQHMRYRRFEEVAHAPLLENSLVYLTYAASQMANGYLRNDDYEEIARQWDSAYNLSDIFNQFGKMTESHKRYYRPAIFVDEQDYEFASEQYVTFSEADYASVEQLISKELSQIEVSQSSIVNVLNLLEKTTSFIPKSPFSQDNMLDVSLFDYSKLTCALATCLYHYANEQQIVNHKQYFFENLDQAFECEAFCLVSFDISGIQSFIYNIRDEKAAKMLKARSFYLEMIAENLIEEVLQQVNVSRANVQYSGGGHAYILIPNTENAVQKLRNIEQRVYDFMLENFGTELYVAIASVSFKGTALLKGREEEYQLIYRQLSEQLSRKKLNRYTLRDILALNDVKNAEVTGRECKMCRSVDKLTGAEDELSCSVCQALLRFAKQLRDDEYMCISSNKEQNNIQGLPIGKDKFLYSCELSDDLKNTNFNIYAKNKLVTSQYPVTNLWVGDYQKAKTFEEYVSVYAQGIQRLAVMRCDVDNLGQAFIAGFSKEHASFVRTSAFSRQMSLFFKYHMNHLLEKTQTRATIIYSGGDDVFIVGGWLDVVEFSIALRLEFLQYTQCKLTLSTGIGLYPAKTPISLMAVDTGELEEAAKHNEKDSIALFSENNVFKWDEFIRNIWQSKYSLVYNFFEKMRQHKMFGKGFVYRLMQLIDESFEEAGEDTRGKYKTISWAKWAYYLSRMEPQKSEDNMELIKLYKQFRELLHSYFANEKEVKQLKMALELYIYTIRGESDGTTNG